MILVYKDLRNDGQIIGISSLSRPQLSSGIISISLGVYSTCPSIGASGGVGQRGAKCVKKM